MARSPLPTAGGKGCGQVVAHRLGLARWRRQPGGPNECGHGTPVPRPHADTDGRCYGSSTASVLWTTPLDARMSVATIRASASASSVSSPNPPSAVATTVSVSPFSVVMVRESGRPYRTIRALPSAPPLADARRQPGGLSA